MRMRGETTRSLGQAVGATSGAVTGWTKGAQPRGEVTRKLAEHFGVTLEVLLDDTRELPGEYALDNATENMTVAEHMAEVPLKAAAALAEARFGSGPRGQAAFEDYLRTIRGMRTEAEALAKGDARVAVEIFDRMLAAWLASQEIGQQLSTEEINAAARAKADELWRSIKNPKPGESGGEARRAGSA